MAKALESVTAECALENVASGSAVEERTPLFELADAIRSFLRVKLSHAPVVDELTATHGVAKMSAPVVGLINICHGSGNAAFRHHGVGFAEKRFAYKAHTCALRYGFDGCAKPRAACADDQNIMFVSFVGRGHRSLKSLKAPEASIRM